MENIFNLPYALNDKYEMYNFPSSSKKMLIISDIHCPYHDIEALTECYKYAKKQHIDSILLNGDTFDFYRLSKFMQDPMKVNLKEELEIGQKFLDSLQNTFKRCKIYFKVGNHEARLESYLKQKAPELFGLPFFDLSEFLHLHEHGIEVIDANTIMLYGKLPIIHGHELRMSVGGVNPSRTLYNKFKTSCVCSHLHRTSDHTEKTGLDKVISTHSIGCMCDLHPDYARINNWNTGFGIVSKDEEGKYEFENHKIIKGKVY